MSRPHLPTGQNIQGALPGRPPGMDMGNGPAGGGRRRPPHQYLPQYHQPHMGPMYASYMPYAPQPYYGIPPQYQNGAMPAPGYMPFQNYSQHYNRSPPAMQQYVPLSGVSAPPSFPPPNQQSPVLATPYQPPPAQAPVPVSSHTPTSSHSSQRLPPPLTPPTPQGLEPTPALPHPPTSQVSPPVAQRLSFRPPLPWLSRPELDFPARTSRRRRHKRFFSPDSADVSLPVEQHGAVAAYNSHDSPRVNPATAAEGFDVVPLPAAVSAPVPATAESVPNESISAPVQTPNSSQEVRPAAGVRGASPKAAVASRVVVPVIPALPRAPVKTQGVDRAHGEEEQLNDTRTTCVSNGVHSTAATGPSESPADSEEPVFTPPPKTRPTSWANLFAKPAGVEARHNGQPAAGDAQETTKSAGTPGQGSENLPGSTFSKANATSVAAAIEEYRVGNNEKVSFLEPRGLINTGNMCYMNSVLQVLMFCVPFWDFLDQVSKRAAHSFQSETPLIDAMVMFMREYKVIRSATSVEKLRRALKHEELERYGEPFTPEFVYEVIRQVPRFASMRRGHQQDAEEFLGFLLQSLDDECTHVMNTATASANEKPMHENSASIDSADQSGDWLEVGRKQRSAVTRSLGSNPTPISRIFGGLLRSEFRVPGLKDSITTEPYQPLQLDIGSPDVRNVVDALRGLTRPERLQGNFNSPRGKDVLATKQVFIESLPPILILHLKRFQFDAEGNGTVKIWKNVGYPLELEIPREALSRQKRQTAGEVGLPRYRLVSVVYHHGKNASGGHYTVDVRRQEGEEWIRMDDTLLRRVRSEDVAEPGSGQECKESRHKANNVGMPPNRFGAMDDENSGDDEDGWKQVTPSTGSGKRWSNVANGSGNGSPKSKHSKDGLKDKVAYLLFYQRVSEHA